MTAPDPAAVQIVADAHAQHLRQLARGYEPIRYADAASE